MNVLSLFDGMSCGQIAFSKLGIHVDNYYASEIDKNAIKVTQANFPKTIQLVDVRNWQDWDLDWSSIDFVSGGFPCQSWSIAGKQLGDKDPRGNLFWTMLDIMQKVLTENPKAIYLMENVNMKKDFENYITYHTEQALPLVNKYLINSALLSAQNRKRFYWTNLTGIEQPEDKGIVLKDILEDKPKDIIGGALPNGIQPYVQDRVFYEPGELIKEKRIVIDKEKRQLLIAEATKKGYTVIEDGDCFDMGFPKSTTRRGRNMKDKSNCLTATEFKYMRYEHSDNEQEFYFRKLSVLECKRLQTVPDNYQMPVSDNVAYSLLGNAWTVDVICHILKGLKTHFEKNEIYFLIIPPNTEVIYGS